MSGWDCFRNHIISQSGVIRLDSLVSALEAVMTRSQTIACAVTAAINLASLVVVALARIGTKDTRIVTKAPVMPLVQR